MSTQEIITALSGWGLSCSSEQLAKPTSEFASNIYTACLEQVSSISQYSLQDAVQNALSSLDDAHPDLYATSIAQNLLLHHLTRFANAAQITDFSSRDLYFPDPERTRVNISAFINFVKFSEQCMPFITEVQEKSESILDEHARVTRELEQVQSELATLKAQREKDKPKCEELQLENNTLTAHLVKTKETQIAVVKDIETLKIERAALLQRKEGITAETTMLMDTINRTRARIVQSPERIKRSISAKAATAVEEKKILALHEAKARDLQAKISALSIIEKDVRLSIEQLQILEKEVQALDASQKELADMKDNLEYKRIERSELQMKKERVYQQLANAQDKFERAEKHAEERRLASQQTIERLQQEYEQMVLERRENDKQVEEIRAEADETERKMAEHLRKSEAELADLLNEYWKLRHETEVYMETLANKLNMTVSSEE